MKNIMKIFIIMLLSANVFAQTNRQAIDKDVVKNVVLINSAPWEVLMSKNGDILAKLNFLPDYLKGYDIDWQENTNFEPYVPLVENIHSKKQIEKFKENNINIERSGVDEIKEIYFNMGSALLSNRAIDDLNDIAQQLNNDKNKTLRLFGFVYEPDSRYFILGKRRMDAVIAYLGIKGVDINTQVIRGNSVKGKNNKIVLAFK